MNIKKIFYLVTVVVALSALLSGTAIGKTISGAIRGTIISVMSWGFTTRNAVLASDPHARECIQSLVDEAELKTLKMENETLKKILSYQEKNKRTIRVAEVVARSTDPTRFVVTLNKGSVDGIEKNKAVMTDEGVLVGIIQDVQESTATVRLIADPQSKIAGRLVNETKTEGVISGGHGIVVRMELIPRTEKIENGVLLLSSGLDGTVPEGLLIGKVIASEEDANTLFQRAIIEPVIDLTRITQVAVIL